MSKIKVENAPFVGRIGGGLFSQTGPGTLIQNTTDKLSLIDGGQGTLSVPANTFKVGDAFSAYMSGVLSSVNTNTLDIHIETTNGVVLVDSDPIVMRNATNKPWRLTLNFTIWAIGVAGVAEIITSGVFEYEENAASTFQAYPIRYVNSTTFDTTVLNTLDLLAEWNIASVNNSIQSYIFNLNQIYG